VKGAVLVDWVQGFCCVRKEGRAKGPCLHCFVAGDVNSGSGKGRLSGGHLMNLVTHERSRSLNQSLNNTPIEHCTPPGTCAALAIPPAPGRRTQNTKYKPRLATQGDFDKAMQNACIYTLVLSLPIKLACTNVICTTAQNADIQGSFLDFFRNIQLRYISYYTSKCL
jgi:hypothetical protein